MSIVHPSRPAWRLRPHPASPLVRQVCHLHGSTDCVDSALELHHIAGSWREEERAAHPRWTWDMVHTCSSADHSCTDSCRFLPDLSVTQLTLQEQIAHFHGAEMWNTHWQRVPDFSLDHIGELSSQLTAAQRALVQSSLAKIQAAFERMEVAGYFRRVAAFYDKLLSMGLPRPQVSFGAGFSGYDRLDERGYDRAGYTATEDHAIDQWEHRTSYQVAYFLALGRIFKLPAGHLIAYDPCYSVVDVVILATLGIRALTRTDPGRPYLRKFTVPTVFYAPGAEQTTIGDAILRTPAISDLLIECADVAWCLADSDIPDQRLHYPGTIIQHYVANYVKHSVPSFAIGMAPDMQAEAPCGEEHMVQWVPAAKRTTFEAARGGARDPKPRQGSRLERGPEMRQLLASAVSLIASISLPTLVRSSGDSGEIQAVGVHILTGPPTNTGTFDDERCSSDQVANIRNGIIEAQEMADAAIELLKPKDMNKSNGFFWIFGGSTVDPAFIIKHFTFVKKLGTPDEIRATGKFEGSRTDLIFTCIPARLPKAAAVYANTISVGRRMPSTGGVPVLNLIRLSPVALANPESYSTAASRIRGSGNIKDGFPLVDFGALGKKPVPPLAFTIIHEVQHSDPLADDPILDHLVDVRGSSGNRAYGFTQIMHELTVDEKRRNPQNYAFFALLAQSNPEIFAPDCYFGDAPLSLTPIAGQRDGETEQPLSVPEPEPAPETCGAKVPGACDACKKIIKGIPGDVMLDDFDPESA
ncbi:SRR1 domain-containing protein [Mycena indigotica]|uniref:SRR1 domain-containing protein n=1 Tax=Mycena indigotica TaxID=2126181 RepID=A0A8H6VSE0_9AGAR|nr:SRR1 domain-containing protein [Mycena indigotica]KAF7292094.1 SRR1 domain-containing protein [Mycena indigotica]